jgi:large subunit ribosomal protein L17
MRHRVFGRKLGRSCNERKALFKSLISSLIIHGEIKTTEAKAKAIRGLVEKLISRAKQKTLAARRLLLAFLQNKEVVSKLIEEIAPRFENRPGGFTRILRIGRRRGDQAMVVKLKLLESQEETLGDKDLKLQEKKIKGEEREDNSSLKEEKKAEKRK